MLKLKIKSKKQNLAAITNCFRIEKKNLYMKSFQHLLYNKTSITNTHRAIIFPLSPQQSIIIHKYIS